MLAFNVKAADFVQPLPNPFLKIRQCPLGANVRANLDAWANPMPYKDGTAAIGCCDAAGRADRPPGENQPKVET